VPHPIKKQGIKVTLLSTGLSVKHNAEQIIELVDDLIVSIDGDQPLHDAIRDIPGAFNKLKEGVAHIRSIDPLLSYYGAHGYTPVEL
jgi:MoaA/NifB/PqqE/SkfB family radical SAM enzyme